MCWNGFCAEFDAGWLAIKGTIQRSLPNVSRDGLENEEYRELES